MSRVLFPHPNYVTPAGYAALQARLARAQRQGAQRDAEMLQERLDSAVVVQAGEQPHGVAAFGARVTVESAEGKRTAYRIVGEDEADPLQGTISWLSPLAQALLDHGVGERVVWQRPAGNLPVRIVAIAYDEPER